MTDVQAFNSQPVRGASIPAVVWHDILEDTLKGTPNEDLA